MEKIIYSGNLTEVNVTFTSVPDNFKDKKQFCISEEAGFNCCPPGAFNKLFSS
jgi:hypothetical protein